ncbi:hypothetical protein HDU67_003083 [Dinochytrium kinnereticum]|nr:hypothetical protein HDU67_003083 [Dinochytrium kinnereticum]
MISEDSKKMDEIFERKFPDLLKCHEAFLQRNEFYVSCRVDLLKHFSAAYWMQTDLLFVDMIAFFHMERVSEMDKPKLEAACTDLPAFSKLIDTISTDTVKKYFHRIPLPSTMTTTFKLYYFPLRGVAELTRFLLEKSGCAWTEEKPDWPTEKMNQPFGQLPVLIEYVDGKEVFRLAQSRAIERYLAKKFGLSGSTAHEQAVLESIFESWMDFVGAFRTAMMAAEDAKQQAFDELFEKKFPDMLKFHEAFLQKNGNNGHYLGTETSYVDMVAFLYMERVSEMDKPKFDVARAAFPAVSKLFDTVSADAVVKAYITSERRMPVRLA